MCISLFSYGRPVVVRCKGVGLGMGWVGSVIWWVGLGWVDENRPTDNSGLPFWKPASVFAYYVCIVTAFAFGEINILLHHLNKFNRSLGCVGQALHAAWLL